MSSRYTDVDSGGEYLVMSSKPYTRPPSEMTDTMMASSSATTSGAYRQSQHRSSKQTSTQYARQHSRPRSGANAASTAAATGGASSASTNWEYQMIPTTADCEGTTTVVLLFDYDVTMVEVEMQTTAKDVQTDAVDQCNGEHTTKVHASRVTDRAFTFTAPEHPEGSVDVLVTVDGRTTERRSLTYQSGALRLARGLTALYVRLLEAVCQFALTRQPTMSGGLLPGVVGMLPGAVPSNPVGDLDQLLAAALADTDADVPAYIYEDLFGVYRMHNAPAPTPAAGRNKAKSMVIGGSSSDDVIATPTLLHLAARRGMVTFIDRLVDLPDSSVAIAVCRDRDGRKAGDLARRAGHIPLADRLDKLAIEGAAAMRVSKKQTDGIVGTTPSSQMAAVPGRTSRRSVNTSSDRNTKASSRHSRESNTCSTKQDQQLIVDDEYVEPEVVGSGIGAVAMTVNTRIVDSNNGPPEAVRTGHRRKLSRDELAAAPVHRPATLSTQITDDAEYIDSDDLPPPSFRPPPPPSTATRRTNMPTTVAERRARAPSAPSIDVDDAPPPVAPRSVSRNAPTPNRTTTLPVRPQPAVRTKLLDSGKNCASIDMASPPEATAELDQLVPAPKPAARPKTNQV